MKHEDLIKELLKDEEFSLRYSSPDGSYDIGRMIKKLRIKNGLTQKELADRLETKQSSIARIENGSDTMPTIGFLEKIAIALNAELVMPTFKDFENNRTENVIVHMSLVCDQDIIKRQAQTSFSTSSVSSALRTFTNAVK